jgi:RHS repeat-associated protein
MATTVRYTTIQGEVIAEKRAGVRRTYVPDPLGSTVALLDNTQAQTDTFTYWPYGEEKSRTGTTATPFRFVGTLGYYRDSASRTYVRMRTFNTSLTRWVMEDPLGFESEELNLYRYAANQPMTATDESGLQTTIGHGCHDFLLPPRPFNPPWTGPRFRVDPIIRTIPKVPPITITQPRTRPRRTGICQWTGQYTCTLRFQIPFLGGYVCMWTCSLKTCYSAPCCLCPISATPNSISKKWPCLGETWIQLSGIGIWAC